MAPPSESPSDALTIITTHINADFDAMASLLAAQKLYPDGVVIFPGSQEKNLRNFFINSMVYLFNMGDIKTIDFAAVKRLVLVDTRQPGRIGRLQDLLEVPGIEVHVYDHHPAMANDVKGDLELCRVTGATVTLLTERIQELGLEVSADEATIMCLGIYEDTGSFTFPSTTEADFRAAAYLLSQGANLNIVSNLISRELGPEQIGLLNDMIQAAVRYRIHGVEIVVTTVTSDSYVTDFAFLVHKMVKMENLDAIFALARMGNKIYVVARSRIAEVDVGQILSPMGGGGHAYAAAASLRETTLAQAEHRLVDLLYRNVQARRMARELMSSPPITVETTVSCKEAASLLTRYNINALPVVEPGREDGGGRLVGYITRQVIEKAIYHRLDAVPVADYMNTEFAVVGKDARLEEIQEKIIENKQRLLPVTDGDVVVGVITRTDLLNVLVRRSKANGQRFPDPMEETVQARTRNVVKFMRERLPRRLLETLKAVGETAEGMGHRAYVVGGFVRDLFLYRPNEDLDIVIEGDGIAFSKEYARKMGARLHTHEKFGTAVVIYPDGFKIDVATARMEYYPFPAALPTVEMSSIKLDLFRRDFTVNTLAIQLNPDRFGTMIDFFTAMRDLKEKVIRVLHSLSFVEDPTRVFRAIRFEKRFGFSIGKLTSGLIENAVKMEFFKRLSGRRVFSELRLILSEQNPVPAVQRLADYRLLEMLHPELALDEDTLGLLHATQNVLSWYDLLFLEESYKKWAVYFLALTRGCDPSTSEEICERFELAPRHRKLFVQNRLQAENRLLWLQRERRLTASKVYRKLLPLRIEMVLFMMAATEHTRIKRAISQYITHLRYVRISVTGQDLKERGLEPGPVYREILDAVRDEKLNGRLSSREEEMAFVDRMISS